MKLRLERFSSAEESTLGLLTDVTGKAARFLCFTLEDQFQTQKVFGETRIPAGTYELMLRTEGGFHTRYSGQFPAFHKGMIQLKDVPGFDFILIHIGNDDDDTAGCLLVGNGADQNVVPGSRGSIRNSTAAYRRIYPLIAQAILDGSGASIEIVDVA